MSILSRLRRGVTVTILEVSDDGDTAQVSWPKNARRPSAGQRMLVSGEPVVIADVNRDGTVITIHRLPKEAS